MIVGWTLWGNEQRDVVGMKDGGEFIERGACWGSSGQLQWRIAVGEFAVGLPFLLFFGSHLSNRSSRSIVVDYRLYDIHELS